MTSANLYTRPTARLTIDELPLRDVEVPGEGLVPVRDDVALAVKIEAFARALSFDTDSDFVSFEVAFPGDVDADSYDAYFATFTAGEMKLRTYEPYLDIDAMLLRDFPELALEVGVEGAA